MCCPEWGDPQNVPPKQLVGVLLLPLQWLQLSVKLPRSQKQSWPCWTVMASLMSALSLLACYQLAWGGLQYSMKPSDFGTQQAKGKEKQGEKNLILWYQLTHPLSQCNIKILLHLQVGQQYNLLHRIHTVSFFPCTFLCAQVSQAYMLPPGSCSDHFGSAVSELVLQILYWIKNTSCCCYSFYIRPG